MKGVEYECLSNNDCLLMIDNWRLHTDYGVSYFWAMTMIKLQDGRALTISLSDGIGHKFKSLDKATEDFLMLDGKLYKLDVTHMDFYKNDWMAERSIYTAKSQEAKYRVYQNRECVLNFKPQSRKAIVEDGPYAIVLVFKQYLIYGYFNGYCEVDGEKILIENAFGHVEHLYSRW